MRDKDTIILESIYNRLFIEGVPTVDKIPNELIQTLDTEDRKVWEIKKPQYAGGGVAARFDVSLDGNGVWRPTSGSGFEIFDKELRGKGLGERFVRGFAKEVGPIGSTGLTPDEGSSESALKMWKRIGAPIEELPNTDPNIGSKRAYVLRFAPIQEEPTWVL
jgi:hypothetical protein